MYIVLQKKILGKTGFLYFMDLFTKLSYFLPKKKSFKIFVFFESNILFPNSYTYVHSNKIIIVSSSLQMSNNLSNTCKCKQNRIAHCPHMM